VLLIADMLVPVAFVVDAAVVDAVSKTEGENPENGSIADSTTGNVTTPATGSCIVSKTFPIAIGLIST
jgi:hypothetical protein